MMLFYSSRAPAHMAEGGDDGKRRCVLDVVGAQGLQSYLKGVLGAARAAQDDGLHDDEEHGDA